VFWRGCFLSLSGLLSLFFQQPAGNGNTLHHNSDFWNCNFPFCSPEIIFCFSCPIVNCPVHTELPLMYTYFVYQRISFLISPDYFFWFASDKIEGNIRIGIEGSEYLHRFIKAFSFIRKNHHKIEIRSFPWIPICIAPKENDSGWVKSVSYLIHN